MRTDIDVHQRQVRIGIRPIGLDLNDNVVRDADGNQGGAESIAINQWTNAGSKAGMTSSRKVRSWPIHCSAGMPSGQWRTICSSPG
jgi:hypothetical protein